jgi:alkanesulfonate monooxygenase SsuD/methylene tetrahydromethanopterin reductase-like flavin-dependent oxidoreductase (luciferase family)
VVRAEYPSKIATYIITLDELSGGRAIPGVGMNTRKMVEWACELARRPEKLAQAVESGVSSRVAHPSVPG